MHLTSHDYHADMACVRNGLCRTATLIAQARQEVAGAILLDNGDFLQGSPLGDYVARTKLRPHPMIRAMRHLGYDAVNLGNHEFSHGIDLLTDAVSDAPFAVLSANTVTRAESPLGKVLKPWTIIDRHLSDGQGRVHLVRVGLVGVLPPETEIWDRHAIDGQIRVHPMKQAVARHIPDLRAAGADVIVVLAHCGPSAEIDGSGGAEGALDIATVDGVDTLIMGHVHMVFPGPVPIAVAGIDPQAATLHGKPAVMPGFFGSHLGVIDLYLDQNGGRWQVVGHRVAARPIASRDPDGRPKGLVPPDTALSTLVSPVHEATRAWVRKPVGHNVRAIHSFFAMVTDCVSVQIVNQAQAAYVKDRLSDGPLAHLPVLSASAPFKAGGLGGPENYTFIPPGDILLRHVADLYIHPNTIMALRMSGADLRNWLEWSVRGYRQVTPGQADQPLLRPELPSFVYDTIGGLTYEIDLSAPAVDQGGQRIRNLRWQDAPLDPAQEFILATNSYRGSGNGGYIPDTIAGVVLDDQTANRDILTAYIERTLAETGAPMRPQAPCWRFSTLKDTSVVFDTSPLAGAFLSNQTRLALTPLNRSDTGFLRLRLSL